MIYKSESDYKLVHVTNYLYPITSNADFIKAIYYALGIKVVSMAVGCVFFISSHYNIKDPFKGWNGF